MMLTSHSRWRGECLPHVELSEEPDLRLSANNMFVRAAFSGLEREAIIRLMVSEAGRVIGVDWDGLLPGSPVRVRAEKFISGYSFQPGEAAHEVVLHVYPGE